MINVTKKNKNIFTSLANDIRNSSIIIFNCSAALTQKTYGQNAKIAGHL